MKSKQWRIVSRKQRTSGEIRYCSRCKRNVRFTDSGKIRQNANGKNIITFAIYKCGKGHTWNKKLAVSKVSAIHPNLFSAQRDQQDPEKTTIKMLNPLGLVDGTLAVGVGVGPMPDSHRLTTALIQQLYVRPLLPVCDGLKVSTPPQ